MKFIADSMVGRLAKWLRIAGYDTTYYSNIEDNKLLEIAKTENRIILTRDTYILKRKAVKKGLIKVLFIKSEHLYDQLKQLRNDLKITFDSSKVRCTYDNNLLVKIDKKDVNEKVPEYVYNTRQEFAKCTACHRIYWKGSHWQKISQYLKNLEIN